MFNSKGEVFPWSVTYIVPKSDCRQGDIAEVHCDRHCPAFEVIEHDCSQANVANDNWNNHYNRYTAFHSVINIIHFFINIIANTLSALLITAITEMLLGRRLMLLRPAWIDGGCPDILESGKITRSCRALRPMTARVNPTSTADAMQKCGVQKTKNISQDGTYIR